MPTEVIDLLAHMNLAQAVFLALMLFGSAAAVWLIAIDYEQLVDRVRRSAAFELAALRWFQARDRARLALVAALLIAVAHLDTSSPISKKGTAR